MTHKPSSSPGTGTPAAERPIPDHELPLPHEREGGPGYAATAPRKVVQQAHSDLKKGQVDTDLHNSGGLDEARRRELMRGEAAAQSPGGKPPGATKPPAAGR